MKVFTIKEIPKKFKINKYEGSENSKENDSRKIVEEICIKPNFTFENIPQKMQKIAIHLERKFKEEYENVYTVFPEIVEKCNKNQELIIMLLRMEKQFESFESNKTGIPKSVMQPINDFLISLNGDLKRYEAKTKKLNEDFLLLKNNVDAEILNIGGNLEKLSIILNNKNDQIINKINILLKNYYGEQIEENENHCLSNEVSILDKSQTDQSLKFMKSEKPKVVVESFILLRNFASSLNSVSQSLDQLDKSEKHFADYFDLLTQFSNDLEQKEMKLKQEHQEFSEYYVIKEKDTDIYGDWVDVELDCTYGEIVER